MERLSDEELQAKTGEFKARVASALDRQREYANVLGIERRKHGSESARTVWKSEGEFRTDRHGGDPKRESGARILRAPQASYESTRMTTRRFCARPSRLVFGAIGFSSP